MFRPLFNFYAQEKKYLGLHYNGIFFNNLVTFSFYCLHYSRVPPGKRAKNNMKRKKQLRPGHFNN